MLWREPNLLWLSFVVVGLGGLLLLRLRRHEVRLAVFAEEALARRLTPELDRRRRVVRIVLRAVALLLVVVALAGPKWGFHWEEVKREGIDLIVAIDTSRSMLATDVKPNRLERAKLAVLDLVQFLQGDRIGLVAFAGTAFLECPLTLDYAAFERSLHATEVGLIPRGGTALARAIETSLAGFEAREGKHEALILITDGEDHEGDLEAAVQHAVEKGVKIYTVGIGTSEGELVPQTGGGGGYVKDRSGQVVKSRLNEEVLQNVALETSGAYVRGIGAALGLDEVFRDHIAKMERREVASSLERRYEDRFQIPLFAAILLLLVESLIGDRKSTRLRARAWLRPWQRLSRQRGEQASTSPRTATLSSDWRVTMIILLSLPLVVGWFDPPGDRAAEGNRLYDEGKYEEAVHKYGDGLVDAPESPLLRFNMGTALYKQGQYAEAIASLSKVATAGDDEWTARAAYNLGNSYYRLGANSEESDPQAAIQSYEQALVAYKRAMAVAPQDTDAKFNHEFGAQQRAELKERLEEQQEEQEQQQEDQQQEDQQQEDQQQEEQEQDQQQQQNDEQKNEEQGEEQEDQAEQNQGQQDEEQQGQQQAGEQKPENDEPSQQDEQANQPEQPQGGGQPEGQQAAAGSPQGDAEATEEQQAAQAVLDTAREEELGPEDIQRPVGVLGGGAPSQDW
jgi:Ca-activated chloride channel family protein